MAEVKFIFSRCKIVKAILRYLAENGIIDIKSQKLYGGLQNIRFHTSLFSAACHKKK